MPGQRRPMAVNLSAGGKHWTAAEVEERTGSEIKTSAPEKLDPPDWLSKPARKLFRQYWKLLYALPDGILSELDAGTLARLCDSEWSYSEASKHKSAYLEIASRCMVERPPDRAAYEKAAEEVGFWSKQMATFEKIARGCANDLGCTISSRCKLVVPKTSTEEEADPLTLLQGRFLDSG